MAHHRAGHTGTRNSQKQTRQRNYRLSADYREFIAEERQYQARHKGKHRDEIRALEAKTFLNTQPKPRLTARRLDIAQVKAAADRARIVIARSPERRRAAMQRHMNTVTHSILKQRGLK